eukprot:9021-Chlamydomonas_euryale.AAC.2
MHRRRARWQWPSGCATGGPAGGGGRACAQDVWPGVDAVYARYAAAWVGAAADGGAAGVGYGGRHGEEERRKCGVWGEARGGGAEVWVWLNTPPGYTPC